MQTVTMRAAEPVIASEVLTIDATAGGIALTSTKYTSFESTNGTRKGARIASISIEGNSIRASFDPAVAPNDATTTGHVFTVGTLLELASPSQIKNFRAVKVGATNSTINVTYWGA